MINHYLIRIGLSILLSWIIGWEREKNDKPCGMRTIMLITLGATLTPIFIEKFISNNFDTIRLIAYYIVAIGFVGGGIITRVKNKLEGITTSALLLPVSLMGFFCGIGEYWLAITVTIIVFIILQLKYIQIKLKRKQ